MSNKRKKYFINNYNNLWKIKHNNTTIYLYLTKNNIHKWYDLLKLIFWRINFMRAYSNNTKPLEIWIYPSNYKKTSSNNIITFDNINSGSTTSYIGSDCNGIICIWRKEEILKVLIHEIIHSFNIDRNDPHPKEAYTELRALIANIYLELLERHIPLTKININKMYEYEKRFGIEQSQKISKYINKNTNIHNYIHEKSRLLHNMNKREWDNHLQNTKIQKKLVPNNSLRFTISDIILKDIPKSDFNGNKLYYLQ